MQIVLFFRITVSFFVIVLVCFNFLHFVKLIVEH